MSERSGASTLAAMTLEEPGGEQASPRAPGPLRCGPCAVWPRQQTWLCAVPLVMGFVGLGLSLMLLKWIVVGSVQDYVPTDLVDPKGSIGQDPIFLSKPSAMPKGPDISSATTTSAATTTAMLSTTTPLAADGTAPAPRTRSGPPANHSANGSAANGDGNRAPHLHNRIGTRISGTVGTTTTHATRLPPLPPGGKEVTPRSTTVRKGSSAGNGPSNAKPGQTLTTGVSTATTTTVKTTTKAQPPTSQPSPPAKPTGRWNHGRSAKGPATRPHHRFRTPMAPTSPSLRSEVFKPCVEDKDLAFCLNEGECSIIETVAGVHRHCRCKEGYHGLRCDQFVPKTDAILSDPTDELGIEFMESGEIYQRQVLSIFSIASGICLLGVACVALYHRNKTHREKLRAHFSESRNLRDCSVNASGLMSKSTPRPQYGLHVQKCCNSHGSILKGGSVAPGTSTVAPPIPSRALSKGKRFRSSSLSLSPAQQRRDTTNHFRTPPISRGRHNRIGGAKVSGHHYKHLQEVESSEMEAESLRRYDSASGRVGDLRGRTSDNMQSPHFTARKGWTEVPCTRLDKGATSFPPPSLLTCSVPIIPSLQACEQPEGGHVDIAAGQQHKEGHLKWHPTPARKATAAPSSALSPPSETVMLVSPTASTILPGSGTSPGNSTQTPCPTADGTVELGGGFKHESLFSPGTVSRSRAELLCSSGTNAVMSVTVLESEGKSTRYTPRLLYTSSRSRSSKAAGQSKTQGPRQGQTSTQGPRQGQTGGANCTFTVKRPGSSGGMGKACSKPSAS